MGISASSLLDDTKSNYIKAEVESELKRFGPYYRRQFSIAKFTQVEEELEQNKEKTTQLLKQRGAPEDGEVLYEEGVFYFDETRKWRERYVVVRANYCLECHDSLETFVKGVPPRQKLLPTGGAVLTTEEKYMAMVDKCFPDDTNVKEDFAPPLPGMPGQFPVYLRLPYRRDSYFCFKQQAKQDGFLSILSDCIRHQNQDFLKKKTCEVQAFLKAIQLYRQDKGKYEAWDMLIGSDVRVMANLVMEQLLPSLEKDMLPRLKAKKTEKKRVWFATVEAAYILIQEHLLEGLSALKDECRASARQQEVLIHSDMDQIIGCRRQLEENVRAKVSEPAEKLCAESVQPYLGSVLEELMEPISSGFLEGRQLSEATMDQVCQDVQQMADKEQIKKSLADMARPNLLSCYLKIGSLREKMQHLQDRFGFSDTTGVIHSAQIDLQQLMENAAYTFEQLLHKAMQDNPDNPCSAVEKNKHRVLKQYDYDSSTVRKRISREALVSVTLPFMKRNLAPTCKTELETLDQSLDSDHANFVHVGNVYEEVLLQTLDKEVTKVVKEAASLKKYNLFTDSRDLLSQSSRSSLSSPGVSTPSSPAMTVASTPSKPSSSSEPQPPSPLSVNGVSPSSPKKEEKEEKVEKVEEVEESNGLIEIPLEKVEQKEESVTPVVVSQVLEAEVHAPTAEEVTQTVKAEVEPVVETPAEETKEEEEEAAAPETVTQEEVISVQAEEVKVSAEPPEDARISTEAPESTTTDQEAPAPETEPSCEEEEEQEEEEEAENELEAPSSGKTAALTPAELILELRRREEEKEKEKEKMASSDPNSLDVSLGSESPPSDVDLTEDAKAAPGSEDEKASSASDLQEDDEAPPGEKTEMVETLVETEDATTTKEEEVKEAKEQEETPSSVDQVQVMDSVKEIRDLVSEVIEVEEMVQRYPDGVPQEE